MNRGLPALAVLTLISIGTCADTPSMKEGLWSVHSQSIVNPGNGKSESTSTLCRDHAYDDRVRAKAQEMKGCTVNKNFAGNTYSVASHCVMSGTVVDSKGTATFTGDTAAHSETHAAYSPPLAGIAAMEMILDEKYLGSCPAGVAPGDRTDSHGNVIHLGQHR